MRAINLDTYSLSLLTAKEDILNPRASTNWALFAYEGITNNLKLFDSGAGGLPELVGKFHSSRPMYGLSRLGLTETGQPQIVMICWVGDDVEECRRTECAVHVPLIKTFFTEAHIFITASKQEEITEEKIRDAIAKIRPPERLRRPSRALDNEDTVGTNYQKTNAAMEIRRINRDSFWARAEREEEQRKEEERRRAMENRRRWEKERVLQEKKEAEERDRKMNEKLQMIEEQRRIQAQVEAESRKEEKARWEQQQREHEEDMRARLRRSESIEKAAEAAVLVSQRSINPREFFRQLSASSQSPGPPRSGKSPFRRYQRSLTDTAFIFERANSSSSPTSPLSPSVNSPFFRSSSTASPISPSYRTFHSPENTHKTPPISRHTSAPPLSPTTSPISRISPIQPSPASTSSEEEPPSSESPHSTENQDRPESFTFNQQEPVIPSPKPPDSISETPLHTIESAVGLCAKAVLVEEDDDDDEELEESSTPQFMKSNEEAVSEKSVTSPLVDAEEKGQESEDESHCQTASESEELQGIMENCSPGLVEIVVQTSEDEDKEDEDHDGDDEIENELSNNQESCVNESEYDFMPEEDEDSTRPINGTEEYVDVSEQSTPERYCYIVNREDTIDTHETDGLTENGQPSPERLLRVRALYDYIAEDETELSFKPGDIISDVEAIDKAWWKGSGKDGHHGLFPANYVETI